MRYIAIYKLQLIKIGLQNMLLNVKQLKYKEKN